jgi:hypothetical protein
VTSVELAEFKETFLNRTNPARTRQRAMQAAIAAASQHNVLYLKELAGESKKEVRSHWENLLNEMCTRYTSRVSASDYEKDIESLKRDMNDLFADRFYLVPHPRYRYDPGFRVSHAQKSLSIALKHLWCLGKIKPPPPQCPVDRIVLCKAGLRYPETRWAYVNSIQEHRSKIAALSVKADEAGLALAEWELGLW